MTITDKAQSIAQLYYSYQKDINWLMSTVEGDKELVDSVLSELDNKLTKDQCSRIKELIS